MVLDWHQTEERGLSTPPGCKSRCGEGRSHLKILPKSGQFIKGYNKGTGNIIPLYVLRPDSRIGEKLHSRAISQSLRS